jgi:hypothetical protein
MKRIILLVSLVLALALPTGVALAGPFGDRIIREGQTVNEDVTVSGGRLVVESGATINGDVFVFGGDVVVDGAINGDLTIYGGTTDVSGAVSGDLVLFGGNLALAESAAVDGECISVGGSLQNDTGVVNCDVTGMPEITVPEMPPVPHFNFDPESRPRNTFLGFLGDTVQTVGRSLMLGLLALVVATIAPEQLRRVSQVITRKPVASGAVGLLTAVAVPSLAALLSVVFALLILVFCLGLLGFPIVFLLLLALAFAAAFGWIAMGLLLGERMADMLKLKNRSVPVLATVGTVTLSLVLGLVSQLPPFCGGGLVAVLVACVGLGATALTQFGTKPYPPAENGENAAKVNAVLDTLPPDDTAAM